MNLESHLMTFVPCFDVSMPWGTPDGWDRLHLIAKAPHIHRTQGEASASYAYRQVQYGRFHVQDSGLWT